MRVHHAGHLATYVAKTNAALAELRASAATNELAKTGLEYVLQHLDAVPEPHRSVLRNNGGGVLNHEAFFTGLAPRVRMHALPVPTAETARVDAGSAEINVDAREPDVDAPDSPTHVQRAAPLHAAILERFQSWSAFVQLFKQTCASAFGSAWVWLLYDVNAPVADRLRITTTANQDSPLMTPGVHVIIALDLWEHAYYLQHQNRRMDYVDAFFKVLSFQEANRRRITRMTYLEPHFAEMMVESSKLWDELEREGSAQVFAKTGGLLLFGKDSANMKAVAANAERHGVELRPLSAADIKRTYGLEYSDEYVGLLEPTAGILRATDACHLLHHVFVKRGGVIHDRETVLRIVPGDISEVHTTAGRYRTRKLVLCPGAWLANITRDLGLNLDVTVMEISVCYWQADPKRYDAQRFPVFMDYRSDPMVYGFPIFEQPGWVKILVHSGDQTTVEARHHHANPKWARLAGEYISKHFPGVDGSAPTATLTCLYTMTPTEDFILDRHPLYPNIIIGGGFSGHGFKLAPVVGKLLSELTVGVAPSHDVSHFRLARVLKPTAHL